MEKVLWTALPYICFTLMIAGCIWRYRTDKFGWTTRSSEIYEHKILRISSPLFHVGILLVAAGHLLGLVIPKTWTEAVGIDQHFYHLMATIPGAIAAVMTILGLCGLLYRRFVVKSVSLATTGNDKLMYVLLLIPVGLGAFATFHHQVFGGHEGYDYRETISPWFRSIFMLQPKPELMLDVPLDFKLHVIAGLLLFAIWPFTRLVHAVTPPVQYATRPYIVYRSKSPQIGGGSERRGWEPVSTVKREDADPSRGA